MFLSSLNENCAEDRLLSERPHGPHPLDWSAVTLAQFADCLCVDAKDTATQHLFQLYEKVRRHGLPGPPDA